MIAIKKEKAKVATVDVDEPEVSGVKDGQPETGVETGIQIIDNAGGKIGAGAVTSVMAVLGVALSLFMW